ncbi:MAG: hypothetical protein HZC38_12590 [Chloroflexi bacterium]|nr:hypothetical protein [Chloroflexota bacterium]MBI5714241.1 hypothetical protein [Chloroflexota bacterium]
MEAQKIRPRFVICVKNDNYIVSLEKRKVYQVIPDPRAAKHRMMRVIDESGEDYLYPATYFVPIRVPEVATKVFRIAA